MPTLHQARGQFGEVHVIPKETTRRLQRLIHRRPEGELGPLQRPNADRLLPGGGEDVLRDGVGRCFDDGRLVTVPRRDALLKAWQEGLQGAVSTDGETVGSEEVSWNAREGVEEDGGG